MVLRRIGSIIVLALAACGSADSGPPAGPAATPGAEAGPPAGGVSGAEFEGFYSLRFEVSSFVPCGAGEQAGYGKGYWLEAAPALGWARRYEAALAEAGGALTATAVPLSGEPVYVRVIADLSPPSANGYGHLNAYEREISVTQILEMTRDGGCRK